MSAGDTPHPDTLRLEAFSQGRITPAERAALQSHLDACPSCCETLVLLADNDPFVARLRRVRQGAQDGDSSVPAPRGIVIDTPVLSAPSSSETDLRGQRLAAAARSDSTAPEVPGYEILAELGRGGMGVVYKARQLGLNRLVALKVLLAGTHASPDDLVRFRGEAEVVAQLRHENVVQIHDIGAHNGLPYFALELCDGGSLAEHARGEPQPPGDAARLVEALARGVSAAHQLGIVHRDLKPANVLLQADGSPSGGLGKPKIADFGLAKWLEHDAGLTGTNAVVGTPSYMAPEQAAGQTKSIGTAADVYALGAILYELLTGRPPFHGPTPLDTLLLVQSTEPVAPSRLQPGVPRDLETICLKCLQKEPARRYAGAGDLAEDLRAFQAHEPIRARPAGVLERGWRWARRRPAIASLLALVVLLTGTGFGLVTWQLVEKEEALKLAETRRQDADSERGKADTERGQAVAARNDAQELSAGLRLDKGVDLAERGDVSAGLFWMLEAARTAPQGATDLRRAARLNFAAWLGYAPGFRSSVVLPAPPYPNCVAFHPDGKRVLVDRGELYWQDTQNKLEKVTWQPPGPIRFLVFGPDGRLLLTASSQGNDTTLTQCWEMDTGRRLGEPIPGPPCCPVFRPDGAVYAVAEGGCIRLRDAVWGEIVRELPLEGGVSSCLAFSSDGKKLVVAAGKPNEFQAATARIWELERGQPVGEPLTHRSPITSVAFSPDGKYVVTGSVDCTAQRWGAGSGKAVGAPLPHLHGVAFVGFAPDGATIVTSDQEGGLCCWDVETGQRLISTLPRTSILAPGFSADGKQVLIAPDSGFSQWDNKRHPSVIETWQVGRGAYGRLRLGVQPPTKKPPGKGPPRPPAQKPPGQGPPRETVQFSPDGCTALLSNPSGRVRLLDVASGQPRGRPIPQIWTVASAGFSSDSQRIALARSDRTDDATGGLRCEVLDTATGLAICPPLLHADRVTAVAFNPDGKQLLTGDQHGFVHIWDLDTGKEVGQPLPHSSTILQLAISPDGRTLLVEHFMQVTNRHQLVFWDLSTRTRKEKALDLGYGTAWQHSPDCQSVVTLESGGEAYRQWDFATGEPTGVTFRIQRNEPTHVRFSRDGRTVLTGSGKGTRLWEAATGRPLGRPMLQPAEVREMAISPDPEGQYLLIGCLDGSFRLWDRATCRPLGPPIWHQADSSGCAFLADGRSFATALTDGSVRDWPLPSLSGAGGEAPEDFDRLRLRLEVRTVLTLRDGDTIEPISFNEWEKRRQRLIELEGSVESAYAGFPDDRGWHDR